MTGFIVSVCFAYIAVCIACNLLLALAGRLNGSRKPLPETRSYSRIAIMVPAYREDSIILSSVKSYGALNYPHDRYEVVVIADSLQPATLEQLKHTGVTVIEVSFDKSTKARSLNAAFGRLSGNYDLALICDADNMLEPDFLLKINRAWQAGEQAIQAQRVAKNMDTPFAVLDAVNEMIANFLYRRGANALGLSSSVIGSGMAFSYGMIKDVMQEIQATGGFDKVLQLLVIEKGHKIYYLEDALVFDEKVESPEAFGNQRRRWVSSQFVYLRAYWTKGWKALLRGHIDYFNLGVIQNLLLPRTWLLATVTLCTAASAIAGQYRFIPLYGWIVLFAANILSLLLPVPVAFYKRYSLTVLRILPKALGIMLMLPFRLKGANNKFIHTHHSKTTIDNPLLDVPGK
ncbi:glycosyltransferase [Chitinophaga sp. Mgbs1]|uniref:Glycosyltransferase n=1 Tax=Chitinophaga solisilvae TaxID=1233460 RepID=A0A3S1B0S0_9BACT|nr:glycosyltransferase [Chitinophaga solisilvae]